MTTFNDLLHQWLPWLTAAGILWRVFSKARSSITVWADELLENHAKHIQDSLDKQTQALENIRAQQDIQIDWLARIADKD